jgi:hypothetical protein
LGSAPRSQGPEQKADACRSWPASSQTGHVLEVSTHIDDTRIVGADMVVFDQDDKITDFQVLMRPARAVQTLAAEAAKRMAAG